MLQSALIKIQILFLIIYFNWRIVTLQYCDGFCNTSTRISHGLPWWLNGKEFAYKCRRPGFDPWVGKIPWRRAWQPTPVFLPGGSPWTEEPTVHRLYYGAAESDTNDWLSTQKIQILISVVFCGSSGMKVKWVEKKRWNEHTENVILHISKFFSNKHITFVVKLGKILLYAP